MTAIVLPGSTVGVLGSGQLGRMFAIAARQMGYRVHVLSPEYDTPTGQVADLETQADYNDLDAVARFAQTVDVLTFEFENVPVSATEVAARHIPVHPNGRVLHTTQNRLREKTFLRQAGFPVTPFAPIRSGEEISAAVASIGLPALLKTASWGYDGKGQIRVTTHDEVEVAWRKLGSSEAILERWIEFQSEISVVAARGSNGEVASYAPVSNVHRHHILDTTCSPARISPRLASLAMEIARDVMAKLDVVGVMCVEYFVTGETDLLINELAPRPHNSGHVTIDSHVTSQFEQQLRAVCGLPLGSTRQRQPAAMANLMGELWAKSTPNWWRACGMCDVKLHLYGKREARPGRKMGHLTALADSADSALELALRARASLVED